MNLTGATDKSTIMVEDFNPHLSVIESIYSLRVYIEIYKKIDYMLDHKAGFNKILMTEDIQRTISDHQSVSSVAQSCPTLCDPMNRSTPGLPVHHQLPEFTQTHVHRVSDAIQPSHPLSSPSPPAPNPSQHQSLFQ